MFSTHDFEKYKYKYVLQHQFSTSILLSNHLYPVCLQTVCVFKYTYYQTKNVITSRSLRLFIFHK